MVPPLGSSAAPALGHLVPAHNSLSLTSREDTWVAYLYMENTSIMSWVLILSMCLQLRPAMARLGR